MSARSGHSDRPHVVVVGAGFGGLACAKALSHAGMVRVTVIDRNNFHTFLPLLYQVATCGLNAADVAYPVRGVLRRYPGVEMRVGTVDSIDADERTVAVDGEPITYDHLVIAAGSRAHHFGIPGAEEHGFSLYSLADAARLRNHVLTRFEAAARDRSLVADGALDVVVVGGGPTGVETAGALAELDTHVLSKDFPALPVERARVHLVEATGSVLGAFSARSQRHALDTLAARGVEIHLDTPVAEVTPTRVRLGDGTELAAHTVVWAAGVQAAGVADALDVGRGRGGRIVVAPDLSVPGCPGVWAIGDVAEIPDAASSTGGTLPQLAQGAIQSGTHVAEQIRRTLAGEPTVAIRYRNKGIMATIGRRAAVAELPPGVQLRGFVAWLAWLGLHLITLMGMRNRASVLVNWAWNYLTWDRGPRLIFGSAAASDPADRPPT
jgi:NADH dehydrogenase